MRTKRKTARAYKPPVPVCAPFLAGCYKAPAVSIGSTVHDEYHGDVVVEGFTKTPIPWPGFTLRGHHVGLMPILFDGLVRAVVAESGTAVAHYWGVSRGTINLWRRVIAGCEDPDAVFAVLAGKRVDPVFQQRFGKDDSVETDAPQKRCKTRQIQKTGR